jgi:hypothetical protein
MPLSRVENQLLPAKAFAEQMECAGPKEFADYVLGRVAYARTSWPWMRDIAMSVSPATIRECISLAYQLSMSLEEGKFVRCNVMLTGESNRRNFPLAATFENPEPLSTVRVFKKLACATSVQNSALLVVETLGGECPKIECIGITDSSPKLPTIQGIRGSFNRDDTIYNNCMDVAITIRGPGHLRVKLSTIPAFTLQAGQPITVGELTDIESVRQLVYTTSSRFTDNLQLRQTRSKVDDSLVRQEMQLLLIESWANVVRNAVAARHGAAFIVLNNQGELSHRQVRAMFQLQEGYDVTVDLGGAIRDCVTLFSEIWGSRSEAGAKPLRERIELDSRWNVSYQKLLAICRIVSDFANTDGCVVLDGEFVVRCFGVKLDHNTGDARRQFVDWHDRNIDISAEMKRLGTRNNSACRFVRDHSNSHVFVVSQDGDLRVYSSDETLAYGFDVAGWS